MKAESRRSKNLQKCSFLQNRRSRDLVLALTVSSIKTVQIISAPKSQILMVFTFSAPVAAILEVSFHHFWLKICHGEGTTYRWVPILNINAYLEVRLGVGRLTRSRGRAPSAERGLYGLRGRGSTSGERKRSKSVIFWPRLVRSPVWAAQERRTGLQFSHLGTRYIPFSSYECGVTRVVHGRRWA